MNEKGKTVNALSEELYLEYEMKYRDSMKKEVDEEVQKKMYTVARHMLFNEGMSVDAVERTTGLPRDDLLRMQAELNGTPA